MREIQSVLKLPRKQSGCVVSGLGRKKIALFRKTSLSENHTNFQTDLLKQRGSSNSHQALTTGVCRV